MLSKILDTTAPIVTITSPTSSDTHTTTSSSFSLSGSASDGSSGVKEVTWSSDKGGSGTADGTTGWSVSGVSLTIGDNKITVTAKDFGGNTSTDTITVTYNAGGAPTATTSSATDVTATSARLTGTVNANGLSTTVWFEYGIASGVYSSASATQTVGIGRGDTAVTADITGLSSKTTMTQEVSGSGDTSVSVYISGLSSGTMYYYRLAAQNGAGVSYGDEKSFATDTVPTPQPSWHRLVKNRRQHLSHHLRHVQHPHRPNGDCLWVCGRRG